MFLIDPDGGKAYRTLSHQSRRLFNRCLCTPLWLAQQGLRIGETRMLQATFPPLPDALGFIDVSLINLAPFVHVPVTPDRAGADRAASDGSDSPAGRPPPDAWAASFPLPPAAPSCPEHHDRPCGCSARPDVSGMDDQVDHRSIHVHSGARPVADRRRAARRGGRAEPRRGEWSADQAGRFAPGRGLTGVVAHHRRRRTQGVRVLVQFVGLWAGSCADQAAKPA